MVILGLDWMLFGSNLLTGLALTPAIVLLGALLAFAATYRIERRRASRPVGRALAAATLAGVVVGAPLPLAGTLVGAWVLALAGLPRPGR